MSDEYERDYWQEYKDDRLMGPPREEPEEEPPLDLEEVEKLIEQRNAEFVDQQREAERRLLDEVLPRLVDELDGYREAEEVWAELDTRSEWAMTASEPPGPDTRWYASAEEAEERYGKGGQLWVRHLTIGNPTAISDEAPF